MKPTIAEFAICRQPGMGVSEKIRIDLRCDAEYRRRYGHVAGLLIEITGDAGNQMEPTPVNIKFARDLADCLTRFADLAEFAIDLNEAFVAEKRQ